MENFTKRNREAAIFYDDNYQKIPFEFRQQRNYKFDDRTKTNGQQLCRFCGKTDNSYHHKAHAVPELLGNKNLISMNECDECNKFFCNYENDLANFLHFELAISGIKGKNGTKCIQSSNFKLKNLSGNGKIDINALPDSVIIDSENKQLRINCDYSTRPYTPLNVAKILTKSICSVLDYDELKSCQDTIQWLKSNEIKGPDISLGYTFVPGNNPFGSGRILILKRKLEDANIPYIFGIFQVGNIQLQLPMVLNYNDNFLLGEKVFYPHFPIYQDEDYFRKFGCPTQGIINLSEEKPTTKKVDNMVFSFDYISENLETEPVLTSTEYMDIPQKTACIKIKKSDDSIKEYPDFSFTIEQESFRFSHLFLPLNFTIKRTQNKIFNFSFSLNFQHFRDGNINKIKGMDFIIDICEAKEIELTNPKLQPFPFPEEIINGLRCFLSKLYIPAKLSSLLGFSIPSEIFSKDFDLQDYDIASKILYFLEKRTGILPAFDVNGNLPMNIQIPKEGKDLKLYNIFKINFCGNDITLKVIFKFKEWVYNEKGNKFSIHPKDNTIFYDVEKVELNGCNVRL